MKVIREIKPQGFPLLIQATTNEEGNIYIPSVRIHPINDEGKVLPALPPDNDDPMQITAAMRLASILYESENPPENN